MTNQSILESVNAWAKQKNLHCKVRSLPSPPSELDMRQSEQLDEILSNQSGVHLVLRTPEKTGEFMTSLCFWIPQNGKSGSKLLREQRVGDGKPEGDVENDNPENHMEPLHGDVLIPEEVPDMENVDDLLSLLESERRNFYCEYVYLPALEDWLKTHESELEIIGGVEEFTGKVYFDSFTGDAREFNDAGGFDHWIFVCYHVEVPEGITTSDGYEYHDYAEILGISDDGMAATFLSVGEEGFFDFTHRVSGIWNGSELINWVKNKPENGVG